MTTFNHCHQVVSSFLAARQDPRANALDLMDEAFTFESPLMRLDDRDSYLQSHRTFQKVVKGMTMISELYGSQEATLLYDLDTATPASVQRTAEYIRVAGGKITSILLIFDSAPWRRIFDQIA